MQSIAELFVDLLKVKFVKQDSAATSLQSYWITRVMSLLALPAWQNPFRAVRSQQAGQLVLLQHIEDNPVLVLGREGYRALAQIQLLHKKTESEQEWARGQVLSWPPWQPKDRMGGKLDLVSPTTVSRFSRVLRRMQTHGYAVGEIEAAMKILAGVDTDTSPTAQVRRSAEILSMPTGNEALHSHAEEDSHHVWLARVEATRTLREAWMCFCAYERSQVGKSMHASVFHAMFRKLFATQRHYSHKSDVLPGDGLEVSADSISPRDLVYIPEKTPTVDELVHRMRKANLRISARLLGELLDHANSFTNGLAYVKDANINEVVRN
ncbi:hypothetical protein LTR66_016417, partial [Elasticomyces elasticus]